MTIEAVRNVGLSSLVSRVRTMERRWADGLALGLGVLLAAAQAPYFALPAAFLAFPTLVLLIDGTNRPRDGFILGWWFGFGYFLAGLYWVGNSFFAQDQVTVWAAPVAVLALAVGLAYFSAFACLVARWIWRPDRLRIVVFAVCWSAFEWLRGHVLTGLPWNLTAGIWGQSDTMMQSVAYLGSYGTGFVTVLSAASFAALFSVERPLPYRVLPPALGIALVLALAGLGAYRLAGAKLTFFDGVGVRIVQANIPQSEKWQNDKLRENYAKYVRLSQSPESRDTPITHIIWPETAVPFDLANEASRRYLLARWMENRKTLITGAVRREVEDGQTHYFNSLDVIGPDGALEASYDKVHLVPFGEYMPLRGILSQLGLSKLVPGAGDFSAGKGLKTIDLSDLPAFGPLICYEIIFPGDVIAPGDRPDWLLNLTNDAWFGDSAGPYQHFSMARFRAVEEGMAVVRAAGTGISAIIDPFGRVLGHLALDSQGILDSHIPRPVDGLTLYARFGDKIYLIMLLMGVAVVLLWRRVGAEQGGDSSTPEE